MNELFAVSLSPWEIVLRGSAVYWFLFLLLRFVLRRDAGSLGIADILLLVLIADATQNAMALVRRGKLLVRNMRREYLTASELTAALREHGIDKLADVKMARMEPDGQISVIRQPGRRA